MSDQRKPVLTGPQSLTWLNDQSRDSESTQWVLWVDDQYRVIKMTVAGKADLGAHPESLQVETLGRRLFVNVKAAAEVAGRGPTTSRASQ